MKQPNADGTSAVPGRRRSRGLLAPADRRLHFGELFQAEVTAFAAEPRLLVAAKRRAHAALRAVDVHVAGAQFLRDRARLFLRATYVSGEAVGRVVGDLDR